MVCSTDDRHSLAQAFLARTDWADASIAALAGDASNRKYHRLTRSDRATAVLMDAPPDKGENVSPFVHIAAFLTSRGLSAPEILDRDERNGFLLLEDLGDALFARVIPEEPQLENSLYAAATDVLIELHSSPPPGGLETYDANVMTEMSALSYDWYLAGISSADLSARSRFATALQAALHAHVDSYDALIQRDYHAENLLWLPDRKGVARVGLLDFQDAMLGHRAYDLVSLIQDARRDVSKELEPQLIDRYIRATGLDPEQFVTAYHCLGAQRNLRILGVFARLSLKFGKPNYIDLIPRVWDHLQCDLEDPALYTVKKRVRRDLPEPTPSNLKTLKDKCATFPDP